MYLYVNSMQSKFLKMIFRGKKKIGLLGEAAGFITVYFIFTTMIFFIYTLSSGQNSDFNYINIMAITFMISSFGIIIRKYLGCEK